MKLLVFDLAGVVLDFGGLEWFRAAAGPHRDLRDFGRFWEESSCADQFYRGRIAPREFAECATEALDISLDPSVFLEGLSGWLRGPYLGVQELLEAARQNHTTACLSNTYEIDVARFRNELRLEGWFDLCFYSNELGLRKPEAEAYRVVLNAFGVAPEEAAFFDDSASCVRGAQDVGMKAFQVAGATELRRALAGLGIV